MRFFTPTRIFTGILLAALPAALLALEQQSSNVVEDLMTRIQTDKVVLQFDEEHGYLRSLLKVLNVPTSSQTLVFSKSSFQLTQIAPDRPRAIYFNDDVYVGWVDHGQFIEITSVDP